MIFMSYRIKSFYKNKFENFFRSAARHESFLFIHSDFSSCCSFLVTATFTQVYDVLIAMFKTLLYIIPNY